MLQKLPLLRFNALFLVPFVCAGLIVPRLYFLQVMDHEEWVKKASQRQSKVYKLSPARGRILDRAGHELAASTMMTGVYAVASKIPQSTAANLAHQLSPVLHMEMDKIYSILTGRDYKIMAHQLDAMQMQEMRKVMAGFNKDELPKDAFEFIDEGKRFYPRHDLAPHVIGFTGINRYGDNTGLEGVEKSYNDDLCGTATAYRSLTNAGNKALEPVTEDALSNTYGKTIVLTIDETIQRCAETVLTRYVEAEGADSGIAVVYGVKTGEILAMANCPSFSLDDIKNTTYTQRRNRCISDAIEPGSVMKIFTFSSLMEEGKIREDEIVDCAGGRWTMGNGRTIVDSHSMGAVPAREVFAESSNIGSVKCASRMGEREFYRHLTKFGFGETTLIDLPGEASGLLRTLDRWSGLSMSSIPIGYELQVTGIQVVAAAAAIANKGVYMQPHIVKEIRDYKGEVVQTIEPKALRQVVSPETTKRMLALMELVVLKGTGKKAALEDYRVGGKTGTTKKLDPETHVYTMKKYIGSFCGVAPIDDPEICIYVWMDNPRQHMYGGDVAAPVFKEIAQTALKKLNVPVSPDVRPDTDELVLRTVKTKISESMPEEYTAIGKMHDDDVSSGCMPKLLGLTMREVQERMAALKVPVRFNGTGYAIDQSPKPYETIEARTIARVTFGTRDQWLSMVAKEAAQTFDSDNEGIDHSPVDRPTTASVNLVRPGHSASLPIESAPGPDATNRRRPTPQPQIEQKEEPIPDTDDHVLRAPQKNGGKSSWMQWQKGSDGRTPATKPVSNGTQSKLNGPAKKLNSMYDSTNETDGPPAGD